MTVDIGTVLCYNIYIKLITHTAKEICRNYNAIIHEARNNRGSDILLFRAFVISRSA